ncbi:MAG: alpha/beta hydrolase [Neisseria sp.]|uniref:RBBP9/YdeN family alpha/beta hydrolase n=1 Tax=Neisseria sp. TaxID=192066 RepID=UPI0026DB9900|nr:alpha/beta hydrolase [Neisseria sp.]MDO4640210.1 alpha/beta hydrolase [Neisseria sp.]
MMNRRQFCLLTTAMLAVGTHAVSSAYAANKTKPSVKKAYIIHGFSASPNDHWFPWLAARLAAEGLMVDNIALPDSHNPDFNHWQAVLTEHIGQPQENDIFIAHSLGTISLLHYLSATHPARIGGLILVAGFGAKLPALPMINGYDIDAYVEHAHIDFAAIRVMSPKIYSIISTDDPIVEPSESLKLAKQLGSAIIRIPKGGHFLAENGFTELPQAWQALKTML